MTTADLKHSPLDAAHRRLGAKLAPFAGWEMPIEYAGTGTLAEHKAVREAAGVFDVSHLGKVEVTGPGAPATLQHALTNDLTRLAAPGDVQYTLCCDERGGIVDDLMVYREHADGAEPAYLLVPNAANWPAITDLVRASAATVDGPTRVTPRPDLAVLAVQGPKAPALVADLFPGATDGLDYMHLAHADWRGTPVRVARTGYTGERGFELILPGDDAITLWDELLSRGAAPVGLGARDTLRLEMGYALHGNDISPDTNPVDARLMWAVALTKPDFRGRAAIDARRTAGPDRVLVGLRAAERSIPRHGMRVLAPAEGEGGEGGEGGEREIGEVTSGTFSPTLRQGVALAYVEPGFAKPGTEVVVDVRGRKGRFTVSRPPFVESSPK